MSSNVDAAYDTCGRIAQNIQRVIRDKSDQVHLAMIGLIAEGHVLVEDKPGVGKTMLARALSRSVGGVMRRIQFTPDLLPSDVTGVEIWNQDSREFVFQEGPVFANIVLADEINRASPKTQSALLEVMEERRVSVSNTTYSVPRPFTVIATQNPIEMDGTYRLPEAQLDRFMLRISMGYPDEAAEAQVVKEQASGSPIEDIAPVASIEDVSHLIEVARDVHVADGVNMYAIRLARATREIGDVVHGVSPRGAIALVRAAKAKALMEGRDHVRPEDVKDLSSYVFAHRLILHPQAAARGRDPLELVAEAAAEVRAPVAR